MNLFEEVLLFLKSITMDIPHTFGIFHICCLLITTALVILLVYLKKKNIYVNTKIIFGIYGISSLILEINKQLIWSIHLEDDKLFWSYSWYSAPFQFCTMPMYLCLLFLFIKNKNVKQYIYDFLGFFSIISMILVTIYPETVFTDFTLVNIHTMVLHCGGLVIDLYVLIYDLAKPSLSNLKKGITTFLILTAIALGLDIVVELSGINNGASFNMFYISPYYESSLPVFCDIQKFTPYPVFLLIYISIFIFGACLVISITKYIKKNLAIRN